MTAIEQATLVVERLQPYFDAGLQDLVKLEHQNVYFECKDLLAKVQQDPKWALEIATDAEVPLSIQQEVQLIIRKIKQ